jgi:hypothetical protein
MEKIPLHAMVTDGKIIGEVVRRQGTIIRVHIGWEITHFGRYGNQYRSIEYGYGNYGAELSVVAIRVPPRLLKSE